MTIIGNAVNNNFQQSLSLNSNPITSVTNPTNAQDAATKNYVDTVAAGLNPAQSVDAATTADMPGTYINGAAGIGATLQLTATGAAVIDEQSTIVGNRYLFKDQATGFQRGIYILTTQGTGLVGAIFTRALDYDQPSDINNTGIIPVINGTVNAGTSWLQTATITAVGTDTLTFIKFSSADSSYAKLAANNAFTGQNGITPAAITSSSGATAWNLNSAPNATYAATEASILSAATNQVSGNFYVLKFVQNASSAKTFTFNSNYKFPQGVVPVVSTTLSAVDIYTFYSDGTNMYCVGISQNIS